MLNTPSVLLWNPMINPKVTGERDVSPITVVGARPGDNLGPPGIGAWLLDNQITPQFSFIPSDIGSTSVTVTIQTNQGVVNP
jgi:hypothetical protein